MFLLWSFWSPALRVENLVIVLSCKRKNFNNGTCWRKTVKCLPQPNRNVWSGALSRAQWGTVGQSTGALSRAQWGMALFWEHSWAQVSGMCRPISRAQWNRVDRVGRVLALFWGHSEAQYWHYYFEGTVRHSSGAVSRAQWGTVQALLFWRHILSTAQHRVGLFRGQQTLIQPIPLLHLLFLSSQLPRHPTICSESLLFTLKVTATIRVLQSAELWQLGLESENAYRAILLK